MSKSKGNAVDPFDALEKYGADAIRWYFYINSAPWLPNRFHGKAVQEGQRKFMGTLWNTYAFFVPVSYTHLDVYKRQENSQDQGDGEDQSTDSLLQDFENQAEDGTAYEQFFGFLN